MITLLWWVGLGWLPDRHPASLSVLLFLIRMGEKIKQKSTWVKMKTGRLLTNYRHWQNILDLREIHLLPIKNRVG